jgi:hypothetical protein
MQVPMVRGRVGGGKERRLKEERVEDLLATSKVAALQLLTTYRKWEVT